MKTMKPCSKSKNCWLKNKQRSTNLYSEKTITCCTQRCNKLSKRVMKIFITYNYQTNLPKFNRPKAGFNGSNNRLKYILNRVIVLLFEAFTLLIWPVPSISRGVLFYDFFCPIYLYRNFALILNIYSWIQDVSCWILFCI